MPPFLLASLILFVVWAILMFVSSSTRREQLIMSIVGLVVAPGALLIAVEDFRNIISESQAPVGIEDLIFAFSLFGIAAVIYHVLLGKHAHKIRGERYQAKNAAAHWLGHLILVLGIWVIIAMLLLFVFNLTSVISAIIAGLMIGIYIIADRKDLLLNALLSGILTAMLVFISEQIFFVRLFPDTASSF